MPTNRASYAPNRGSSAGGSAMTTNRALVARYLRHLAFELGLRFVGSGHGLDGRAVALKPELTRTFHVQLR
jgi:hypothetical protein